MDTPPLNSSLNGLPFVSLKVTDMLGRRVVEHSYPRSDRTDFEDVGGLPARYQVEAVVFGPGWMDTLRALRALAELQQPAEVTYVHPFWGSRTGVLQQLTTITSESATDHAQLRFTFVEGQLAQLAFEETQSVQGVAAGAGLVLGELAAAAAALELS